MNKLETHFKQNQNDAEKLEKVVARISEFIDKLKQDAPVKKLPKELKIESTKEPVVSLLKQKREAKL